MKEKNISCKLLISYHKKDYLLKDNILTPIHAGRSKVINCPLNENSKWLIENTIGDDSGENISEKNESYNEMTTIYWAWKNYEKLDNPQWIGFMHYRRHFLFKNGSKSCYENEGIYDGYLDEIGYSEECIQKLLRGAEFIVTRPQYRVSMYEHFKRNHRIEDLEIVIGILKEKYPNYTRAADTYLEGKKAYFCNMFIFPKNLFMKYSQWIFDILFEFERRVDIRDKRLFISEWLTGIFIQNLIDEGKKGVFLPTIYAESDHIIPIILAADENYAMPMSVTIASLLKNAKKNTKYDIYILVPEEFSMVNKYLILSLQELSDGCSITFVNMKESFSNTPIKTGHLTKVCYYRLKAASILSQYDKCLYVDVDTVIEQDLSILFRMSLDSYCIAGVKAAGYYFPESWADRHSKEIGLPSIDHYVNSGVLLMNLKLIREKQLEKKFIELSERGFSSEDQDVINVACYDEIKDIFLKYNLMNKYFIKKDGKYIPDDIISRVFIEDEIKDAVMNPVIIHFADKHKPWKNPEIPFAEFWWKYSVYSPFFMIENVVDCKIQSIDYKKEYERLIIEARFTESELNRIKGSWSYRLGCVITFIPRRVRRLLQNHNK